MWYICLSTWSDLGYLTFYYQGCGIFETLFGTFTVIKKQIKVEVLHGIHRRDIGCSSVDFQGYRILMTPSPMPPPPPPPPPTHTHTTNATTIISYTSLTFSHACTWICALFCLLATGPVSAYQCAEVMQAARNSAWFLGYVLCMKSLSEAFHGGVGNKGSCSLVFSFQGTLENILWERGSKTNVMAIGNIVILKITFREHGRLF